MTEGDLYIPDIRIGLTEELGRHGVPEAMPAPRDAGTA